MEERCQIAVLHQEDGHLVEEPWTREFCGGTERLCRPSGAKTVKNGEFSELLWLV